jgi:hypothetical protein
MKFKDLFSGALYIIEFKTQVAQLQVLIFKTSFEFLLFILFQFL